MGNSQIYQNISCCSRAKDEQALNFDQKKDSNMMATSEKPKQQKYQQKTLSNNKDGINQITGQYSQQKFSDLQINNNQQIEMHDSNSKINYLGKAKQNNNGEKDSSKISNVDLGIDQIIKRQGKKDEMVQKDHLFKPSKTDEIQLQGIDFQKPEKSNCKVPSPEWLLDLEIIQIMRESSICNLYQVRQQSCNRICLLRKLKKCLFKQQENLIKQYRNQIDELVTVEHPNIAQIYEIKEDDNHFYILMEYCKGGNLFNQLEQFTEMSENLVAEITRQMLSAIVYLHQKNITYGNLNPDVFLLEKIENNQDQLKLKLINLDIQYALIIAKNPFFLTPTHFLSPEALQNIFCKSQDVWAIGILFCVLLTGNLPYKQSFSLLKSDDSIIFDEIIKGNFNFEQQFWNELSDNAVQFAKLLLETDPTKQIEAVIGMNNKWLLILTKARKNNQRKILNSQVLQLLKQFMIELRLVESFRKLTNHFRITQEENKILLKYFKQVDKNGSGDLKMDQIKEINIKYGGKFVNNEMIDIVLSQCTIQVSKGGMIKYSEYLEIKATNENEFYKKYIMQCFEQYENMKYSNINENNSLLQDTQNKKNFLSKIEVKKIIQLICKSNNNQYDSFINDSDTDCDGFLSIHETLQLLILIDKHQ